MKTCSSLIGVLLLSIPAAVFAQQGNSCLVGSESLNTSEGISFLTSCLERVAQPSNVKEEKLKQMQALCAQNAKNKKLQNDDKRHYIDTCMKKNEAAEVYAKLQPGNSALQSANSALPPGNSARQPGHSGRQASALLSKKHR